MWTTRHIAVICGRASSALSHGRTGTGPAREMQSKTFGRTGALGIKAGMIAEFDKWGTRHELTVIQLDDCQAVWWWWCGV